MTRLQATPAAFPPRGRHEDDRPVNEIQPRLNIRQISKPYEGIHALRDIGFDIALRRDSCSGGENGAGKSTPVRIITGIENADSGQILLNGIECHFRGPIDAHTHGVVAVQQDPKLYPGGVLALSQGRGGDWPTILYCRNGRGYPRKRCGGSIPPTPCRQRAEIGAPKQLTILRSTQVK